MERPMRRWISTDRPSGLPRALSRGLRSCVEYGSIEYSAVSHPPLTPCSFIQRGTPSLIIALQITRVLPKDASTEPWALGAIPGSKKTGRSAWKGRPSGRSVGGFMDGEW